MDAAAILRAGKTGPPPDLERQLQAEGLSLTQAARSLEIRCHEDYQTAAECLRDVKGKMKAVKEYWKGPKGAAKTAHQQVCDREKAMLAPLEEAEGALKGAMARYQAQAERERLMQEAELRRRQQEEADRLLNEAAAAAECGDKAASEAALAMAQLVEEMPAVAAAGKVAAAGVSTRMIWKARVTDEKAVPVEFGGAVIRPVDMGLLNQLARTTRGTARIAGVEFYQEPQMAVR